MCRLGQGVEISGRSLFTDLVFFPHGESLVQASLLANEFGKVCGRTRYRLVRVELHSSARGHSMKF